MSAGVIRNHSRRELDIGINLNIKLIILLRIIRMRVGSLLAMSYLLMK